MSDKRLVQIAALAHSGGLLHKGGDANYILNLIKALTLPEFRNDLIKIKDMKNKVREAERNALCGVKNA